MSEQVDHIEVRSDGAVRVVTLARPEKKNAFTFAMYDALARALAAADEDDGVRVVLVTGTPGVFTAGNDLADFMQLSQRNDRNHEADENCTNRSQHFQTSNWIPTTGTNIML